MSKTDFDAIIIGGGVVGAVTAKLLADHDWRVCLIDHCPVTPLEERLDSRVVAISPGSQRILTKAGIWSTLPSQRLAAYREMQVESPKRSLVFRAQEHGLSELGWIIETRLIQNHAWQTLQDHSNAVIKSPARWHDWQVTDFGLKLRLLDSQGDLSETLNTRLLIAADGAKSKLRQEAEIETATWDYNQVAWIGPVVTEKPNSGLAWQRFLPFGPLALLPLPPNQHGGTSSIVWSIPRHEYQKRANYTSSQWLECLNEQLSGMEGLGPMGKIESIADSQWVPLKRHNAHGLVKDGLVLVGDAAHGVHPLAGQGLNLGIADSAALVQCLIEKQSLEHALTHYERWRLSQSTLAGAGIHVVNELQRLPSGLGRHLLGLSFGIANQMWPIRDRLLKLACGIDSGSPVWAQA